MFDDTNEILENSKFIVIDFETANHHKCSPCAVGICIVENFKIIEKFEYYINPQMNFSYRHISLHGIHPSKILPAPIFPKVWDEIYHYFDTHIIVAHNAVFDVGVLLNTLCRYKIKTNKMHYICTLEASRNLKLGQANNSLKTICDFHGIELINHHNALSDAIACAELLIEYLQAYTDIFVIHSSSELKINYSETVFEKYEKIDLEYYSIEDLNEFVEKNVAITGEIAGIERPELIENLEVFGAKIVSRISKKTNYVIVGYENKAVVTDKTNNKSRKILKAEEFIDKGIDIRFVDGEKIKELIEGLLCNK